MRGRPYIPLPWLAIMARVASRSLGKGGSFAAPHLARAGYCRTPKDCKRVGAQRGRMREILIVDDEESIRSLLLGALSPDFSCSTASNVAEAKIFLATGSFKVLLTDINMPGASGLDLLAHVKQEHPAIVIVVMSANGQAAAQALAQGAFDLIEKPFNLLQVSNVIRRALEHCVA